jgi:DNA repair protein RadC
VRSPVSAWRIEDRPAEKLLRRGASACTDAELLSLLIPRGTRQSGQLLTRLDIARLLVQRYGSLDKALARSPLELAGAPGIGRQVAARLSAAGEIARRIESQRGRGERIQVCSPADVAATYGPLMRNLRKEVFKVVLLNTANVIISDFDASVGGLAASIVEPRAVFRRAILESAAAVICLHNHPSHNPEPSRQDIRITRQLIEAGEIMGIPLHDHIIIAGAAYTSLAERGVLNG